MSDNFVHSLSGFFDKAITKENGTNVLHPIRKIPLNDVLNIAAKFGVLRDHVFQTTGPFDNSLSQDEIRKNSELLHRKDLWHDSFRENPENIPEIIKMINYFFGENDLFIPTIRYFNYDMYHQDIVCFNLYEGYDPDLMVRRESIENFKGNRGHQLNYIGMVEIIRSEAIYVYLPMAKRKNYDFLFELKKHFGDDFLVSSGSRPSISPVGGFIYYRSYIHTEKRYLSLEQLEWKRSFLNIGYFNCTEYGDLLVPANYRKSFPMNKAKEMLAAEEDDRAFCEAIVWGEEYVRLPWLEPFVEKSARYALALREVTDCDVLLGDERLGTKGIQMYLTGPFIRGKHF